MNSFIPYRVRQLQLADWPGWKTQVGKEPLYAVVWHKSVPLTDFYVHPGERLSVQQLKTRIEKGVKRSLRHYIETRLVVAGEEYDEAAPEAAIPAYLWETGTLVEWQHLLDDLLQEPLAIQAPKVLPISVIICTRHRRQQLEVCLRSLEALPYQPEEVVVVDNGPDDPATAALMKFYPQYRYLAEPRPGLDVARNTGLKAASQPIIAYLDDDVKLHSLWLLRLWMAFADPQVAALTGLVLTASLDTEAQYIFERFWGFNRGFLPVTYTPEFLEEKLKAGPPVWNIGAGANMAFRKSIFEKTGLFDERLDAGAAGCNGDSEMWFRILKAGYTIRYEPLAVAWHEHRRDMGGLKQQIFYYMRGFTAAALLQQAQLPEAGYKKHLQEVLPPYYLSLIRQGFPYYRGRFSTLGPEIKGMLSGYRYYRRHCQTHEPALP